MLIKFITLENGLKKLREILASFISFDNTGTSLIGDNVQDVIVELSLRDTCLDGGFANSVYTPEQCFDGGGA